MDEYFDWPFSRVFYILTFQFCAIFHIIYSQTTFNLFSSHAHAHTRTHRFSPGPGLSAFPPVSALLTFSLATCFKNHPPKNISNLEICFSHATFSQQQVREEGGVEEACWKCLAELSKTVKSNLAVLSD